MLYRGKGVVVSRLSDQRPKAHSRAIRLVNPRSREWGGISASPLGPRPREGPLAEPTAGAQPLPRERVLMRDCVEKLVNYYFQ